VIPGIPTFEVPLEVVKGYPDRIEGIQRIEIPKSGADGDAHGSRRADLNRVRDVVIVTTFLKEIVLKHLCVSKPLRTRVYANGSKPQDADLT
jgi:hypothetical protein